jgi:phytol kinase
MLTALLYFPSPLRPWLGIAVMLGASRLLLAAVGRYARRCRTTPEGARKALHVGMGTLFLACPWLFDRPWPMLLLAAIFVSLLIARLYFPPLQYHVAGVIYGVERKSLGEYYFPLIAAFLFTIFNGDVLLYAIPVSLLVYADAAAALVGTRYGTWHFPTTGARKSLEGSTAFVVTAFFTTHVPLLLAGRVSTTASLVIAIVIAVLSAAIEVFCRNGLDNVAVPLLAFALLRVLQ